MSSDGDDGPKRIPPASLGARLASCDDLQCYLWRCMRGTRRHNIEEISRETYERLVRLLPGEFIEDLERLILGVAWHVARDFAIKNPGARKRLSFEPDDAQKSFELDQDIWLNQAQSEAEMDLEFVQIARQFPRHLLTTLILCERDGFTYEEVAAELDASMHTIKKWLVDATAHYQLGGQSGAQPRGTDTKALSELRIARAAAMWRMRLQSEGRACYVPFQAWLTESNRHLKAYLLAATIAPRLKALGPLAEIDVRSLVPQVKNRVVPLIFERHDNPDDGSDPVGERPRAKTVWAAAAVLLMLVAGGPFFLALLTPQSTESYSTVVGEQRPRKTLGRFAYFSQYQLPGAQVSVRYTAAVRYIELLKGEALFTVERDRQRPFRVTAGRAVVNTSETEFDVYRQPARTVIEGVRGRSMCSLRSPGIY